MPRPGSLIMVRLFSFGTSFPRHALRLCEACYQDFPSQNLHRILGPPALSMSLYFYIYSKLVAMRNLRTKEETSNLDFSLDTSEVLRYNPIKTPNCAAAPGISLLRFKLYQKPTPSSS